MKKEFQEQLLTIKVRSDIRVNEQAALQIVNLKNRSVIARISRKVVSILKSEAPVRTGRFRESIKVLSSIKQPGDNFTALEVIGPTAPHSKFVVRRTKASPGGYIPAIDARIKSGNHPGTKANRIIHRSINTINAEAQRILNDEYGHGKFNVVRFLKST